MGDAETGPVGPDTQERVRALALPVGVPLFLGVVLGALGGWCWWTWWGPAPDGVVLDTLAGNTWYPDPYEPGVAREFAGTATFVVVGAGLALLLGVVAGWLARHRALAGLVAVVVAAGLGAAIMTWVGQAMSPPDPQAMAASVEPGTELPGHLEIASHDLDLPDRLADAVRDDDGVLPITTPWLAWPVGALLGYLIVMLSLSPPAGALHPVDPRTEPAAAEV